MTLTELYNTIIASLTPSLGQNEAKATARLLLEDDLGVTREMLVLRGDRVLEPETVERYTRFIDRIKAGEPPQYLIGSAHFMGMDIRVTPDVLIPRPETAELCDIIIDHANGASDLRVADLGTGSGCIALALGRGLVFPHIDAYELSAPALAVARDNARKLMVDINFIQADILKGLPAPAEPYDIIVSNPPYIADSEKPTLEPRVLLHEPAMALFVPDSDPLEFYRAIGQWADTALKPSGTLYFEINPVYAVELQQLMGRLGFSCDLVRDAFANLRFAICHHRN